LNYSEPTKGKMIGAELHITETKQKQKYIADHTVHEYKSFVNNIDSYLIEVLNEINLAKTRIKNQLGDGLEYWIGKYLDLYRSPGRTLSQATVDSDRSVLNALLHYLFTTEPQIKLISDYNNIVHNNYLKDARKMRGWSDLTVKTNHIRIKSFFNWLKTQYNDFYVELSLAGSYKRNVNTDSFTQMEVRQIQLFIDNHRYSMKWGWFIDILIILLETGCRLGECVNMRVKDYDRVFGTLKLCGKGNKTRTVYVKSPNSLYILHSRIYINGVKKDKSHYIFHKLYYKKDPLKVDVYIKNEKIEKPYSKSGIDHKFKKMVRKLNLNDNLSPHSCRRFFITEMLKATNGNVPLVAELVGHSSWDMVKHYTKSVINNDSIVNVDFEKLRPRFTI
jgi:integrase